jgi:aminopeptidase N
LELNILFGLPTNRGTQRCFLESCMRIVAPFAVITWLLPALAMAGAPAMMHYDFVATLDPPHGALSASVTITVPAAQVTSPTVFLLSDSATIDSIDVIPRAEVAVSSEEGLYGRYKKITIRRVAPGSAGLCIHLRYGGLLGPSGDPPLNRISVDDVELNLDSLWVPIREGFASKLTWAGEIRGIRSDLRVVAPGRVERSRGHALLSCRVGSPDIAFVAIRGLQCAKARSFEFYARDLGSKQARDFLRQGTAAVKFLEAWFGRMPVRPMRVVMVQRERAGGYSRPGYIVVVDKGPSPENEQAKFIAHEFAHEWWATGASDTEDRWLSETLAEYVGLRYVESAFGTGTRDAFLASMRDASKDAGPVLGPGRRSDEVLYQKGPLLLFALEERIGRERLDHLLASFATKPPQTTAEFLQALSRTAGEEHAREFERSMRQ